MRRKDLETEDLLTVFDPCEVFAGTDLFAVCRFDGSIVTLRRGKMLEN